MATTEIQKLSLLARFFQKEFFSHGSRLSHAKLDLFILIAFLLHISIVTFDLIAPLNIKKPPPPIKVRYVDIQTSELLKHKKPHVNSLKKSQNKKNKSPKLIASAKPKILAKQQSKKQKKQRKRSVTSKTHITTNITKQPKIEVAKREKKKIKQKAPAPSLAFSKKETLSMLDGFHPEKYASQDLPIEKRQGLDNDEPISLDTKDKKYISYFGRIKQQIQRAWIYPTQGTKKRLSGEVTLRFEISKGGNLIDLRLINTSGVGVLDINAIKAVKEAAPYYPFPKTISKNKLSILATFVYSAN